MKLAIVASTDGGVMNQLLANQFFKSCVRLVVVDRDCGALQKAQAHGVSTRKIDNKDRIGFSDELNSILLSEEVDWAVLFFTRLLGGAVLDNFRDRIVNLHPSLLPAFPGMDGFGDTVRYGCRIAGTTIHLIDKETDQGKIIMQTTTALDPDGALAATRHQLFTQQCQSLLQVLHWIDEERLIINGRNVHIQGAKFDDSSFFPALEHGDARSMEIPSYRG